MATNAELKLVTAEKNALQKFVQILHAQSISESSPLSPQASRAAEINSVLSQLTSANRKSLSRSFLEKLIEPVEAPTEPLTEAGVHSNIESTLEQEKLGKLQEDLLRSQRASTNAGREITVEELRANDVREAALRKTIEAGPLPEGELQQKLAEIRPLAEAEKKNVVEEIIGLNSAKIEERTATAMSKLVTAAGKGDQAGLHETVRSEFIRTIESGGNVETTVREFAGRQKNIDIQTRTLFQQARGVLSGQLGTERGVKLLAEGKAAAGTKAVRGAKLKGRGIAGALAIPLLLALFRGGGKEGGDQPEELDLRQLFLQRQSQELAGSQAKLNSQLGLNDARRTKATAQAEGQLLRNLLLRQRIFGGGSTSLP